MADLLVMALLCNQTKVFNMVYFGQRFIAHPQGPGQEPPCLHPREPTNAEKGYQINSFQFVSMR